MVQARVINTGRQSTCSKICLARNIYRLSMHTLRASVFLHVGVAPTGPCISAMTTDNIFFASPSRFEGLLHIRNARQDESGSLANFSFSSSITTYTGGLPVARTFLPKNNIILLLHSNTLTAYTASNSLYPSSLLAKVPKVI